MSPLKKNLLHKSWNLKYRSSVTFNLEQPSFSLGKFQSTADFSYPHSGVKISDSSGLLPFLRTFRKFLINTEDKVDCKFSLY